MDGAYRWRAAGAVLAAATFGYAIHHPPPTTALPLVLGIGVLVLLVLRVPEPGVRVIALGRGRTVVSEMTEQHVGFAAALHRDALPHGFFASLGHGFLRAYYAGFVASPHAVALAAVSDGQPVGMVVGSLRPRDHVRWIVRQRGWRLAAIGAGALAIRPRTALRFARTRVARYTRAWARARHDGGRFTEPAAPAAEALAVLSHVAVLHEARGEGIGRELVATFVDRVRAAGASRVVLTTLDGPDGAAAFYEREGWTDDGVASGFDGQRMRTFSLRLSEDRT